MTARRRTIKRIWKKLRWRSARQMVGQLKRKDTLTEMTDKQTTHGADSKQHPQSEQSFIGGLDFFLEEMSATKRRFPAFARIVDRAVFDAIKQTCLPACAKPDCPANFATFEEYERFLNEQTEAAEKGDTADV